MYIKNKGSMFGLDCRALKKQFGKLFLASRHSEAPQGINGSCGYTKRGAMFGLDARIALAIFGALSVISGAALYSAIQDAKVTAIITQVENIGKAMDQYYLDVGSELPIHSASSGANMQITDLLADSGTTAGYNGPYISIADSVIISTDSSLIAGDGIYYASRLCKDEFGNTFSSTNCPTCSGGTCSLWIKVNNITLAQANALIEKVDGTLAYDAGRVRVTFADATATDNLRLYYKYRTSN